MDPIPPTYSFPLTGPARPAGAPARPTEPAAGPMVDRVEIGGRPVAESRVQGLRKLIAAQVSTPPIADMPPRPAPTPGVLDLYAHPADRHAAATGVTLGRQIDVSG